MMIRVLLATARRWPTTTRLALAISQAGANVDVLCPPSHWLERLTFVRKRYRYSAFAGIDCCRSALRESGADIVIPADDYIAANLHALFETSDPSKSRGAPLRGVIATSLGDFRSNLSFYARDRIAKVAKRRNLRSPNVNVVVDDIQLSRALKDIGYPAVLKTDGSSGGDGVRIVYNALDARAAFQRLSRRGMVRALKDLVMNFDFTALETSLRRNRPRITIQPFIPGRNANAAVACYRGELLAHVSVEVLASISLTGPSTIVRVIDHPGISAAAEEMVQTLNLSGLCGFDFILDDNDKPYLIDFNPRATQTSHLVSHDGRQPVAWLIEHLRGCKPAAVMRPNLDPIVLFPHGFFLNDDDLFAQYVDADVPPNLVFREIGLEYERRQRRLINKVVAIGRKLTNEAGARRQMT